jgi:hypothetical protein
LGGGVGKVDREIDSPRMRGTRGGVILDLGFAILDWCGRRTDFAMVSFESKIQNPRSKILLLFLVLLLLPTNLWAQSRQAQLSWWDRAPEEKVGHYWIKTDLPADEANSLARHLNFMYGEYSKRLASMPVRAQEKLNVLIFKDRNDYALTLRARFGVNPAGTGGIFFVTPLGSGLAFWTEDLPRRRIEHVVQHEGFHQFAYSRFGDDLPSWVNEGLAEFFGEAIVVGETFIIGQSTPRVLQSIKDAIEKKTYVPFQAMLRMTPKQWNNALSEGGAEINYNQSWSMVHFLVYGEGGKYVGPFETYLKHLNNGLPSEQAFIRAFGNDIEGFERQWKRFALDAKPSAFVTAMERIEFLAEGSLELSKQDIHPDSLNALREALQKIGFTHTVKTHGVEIKLNAKDDSLFTIPKDDFTPADVQPAFTVTMPELARMSKKERMLEEANKTPATIATQNLMPRSMHVRWIRDNDTNKFSYQIVVK